MFVEFCIYFNGNQDYFECHEVLEEYWKDIAPGDKQHLLVGLVQIATGMYHWRRGNYNGAHRIFKRAFAILQGEAHSPFLAPFDKGDLVQNLEASIQKTNEQKPFQSFSLYITDENLKELVSIGIAELPSQKEEYLLHKHKLRDRSDIIEARQEKLLQKQLK